MMWFLKSILSLIISIQRSQASISNEQYGSLPELFHQDNFDKCSFLNDEFLYCSFEYHMEPNNPENPTWDTIQEIISNDYNYRHDVLRHWICVPFTCPDSIGNTTILDEIQLNINDCYDKKMKKYDLKGKIRNLDCVTTIPKYQVDYVDVATAFVFLIYGGIIIISSLVEIIATRWCSESYNKYENTLMGKIIEELIYLQPIQGIRFINTILVIFHHTCMLSVMLPVVNTHFIEKLSDKYVSLLLSGGSHYVIIFFVLSSMLLTYGVFKNFKNKKLTPKILFSIFLRRYIRLTPTMMVVVWFNATLWRHLGDGPVWYNLIGRESTRCRENWWTHLFYLNTLVNSYNMCTPTLWYLAEDTRYFISMLVLLWYIKIREKHIWYVLGTLLSISTIFTFLYNYINDFETLIIPRAESVYNLKYIVGDPLWHWHHISHMGNACAPIIGVGFGYLLYKTRHVDVFGARKTTWEVVFCLLTYLPFVGIIIIPGWYVFIGKFEHDAFISSWFVAVTKPIFVLSMGWFLFGCIHGIGGLADKILRWQPMYILGRLTYSVYLGHFTLLMSKAAVTRTPVYVNHILVVHDVIGDLIMSYILAFFITILLEMPISSLQRLFIPPPSINDENKNK